MRMLIALLPLLGLVAAQYNARGNVNDGFFNDLGQSTSTLPPWANPAGNVGGGGGVAQHPNPIGGSYGGSQSSTKPPAGGVAPIGNPQLPAMPGANADPSKSGGSSGGMTGFGAIDYFNGGGGPDVLSPQAAPAPAGGSNTNQNSGPYGIDMENIPDGTYEAAYRMMQQTKQNGQILPGELGGGIGVGAGTGKAPGRTSGEKINPDYFGGGAGVGVGGGGQGANHGPNGGNHGMMGAGQVPSRGSAGGSRNGGINDPNFNTGNFPSHVDGFGAQAPARSSGEVHYGNNGLGAGGMVPNGGGMGHNGGGMGHHGGGMGAGGGGGRYNNLLSQGDKEEGGNASASTAAGIAAGALIVAAAVGAVAFIVVRKRKHSRLINSV